MRKLGTFVPALVGWMAAIGAAAAQDYPTRPITLIIPLAAGGGTDVVMRILAERMKVALGQPIVIDNVPTAAGTVGVARAARATPDGYTLAAGDQTSFVVSSIVNPVQHDVLKDFAPISLLSTSPVVMVGANSLPYRDLRELIEGARTNPGKATFATFGQGSAPHIIAGAFQAASATRFQIVPYRGTGPALQDLVAGHVDVMVSEIAGALPYLRERRIRAYALLAPTRSKAAPEIPTIEEAGGPPLHVVTWRGLWAPRGTPASIVEKLNAAVVEALADPEIQKRVADIGQEIVPRSRMNPGALAAHHKAEMEKWQALIKTTSP